MNERRFILRLPSVTDLRQQSGEAFVSIICRLGNFQPNKFQSFVAHRMARAVNFFCAFLAFPARRAGGILIISEVRVANKDFPFNEFISAFNEVSKVEKFPWSFSQ